MAHCVFLYRPDSRYNDSPSERYHFPKRYLSAAKAAEGDWVVFLESSKIKKSRGYFAVAKIAEISVDPDEPEHFFAHIQPGQYVEFSPPVPFNDGSGPIEAGLLNAAGQLGGNKQSSVRRLSNTDFSRILARGLTTDSDVLPRIDASDASGFAEEHTPFVFEEYSERVKVELSRVVRDATFRRLVLQAYGERCAITGLRFINGGGRAEVNAAHIRPVEHGGPDAVQNGLALSGTAHWMFDRGLIGLQDDYKIIVSRHVNDLESAHSFINKTGFAHVPADNRLCPSNKFLDWHRKNILK
jgi:putative restriction endonuclease